MVSLERVERQVILAAVGHQPPPSCLSLSWMRPGTVVSLCELEELHSWIRKDAVEVKGRRNTEITVKL